MTTKKDNQKPDLLDFMQAGKFLARMPGGVDKWGAIKAGVLSQGFETMQSVKNLVALDSIEYIFSYNPFHSQAGQTATAEKNQAKREAKNRMRSDNTGGGAHCSPAQEEEAEIFIGTIILNDKYGGTVTIPMKSFAQHSFILGTTGSGKSWLVKHIAPQLQQKGITVIVFDCEGEYAKLLKSCSPGTVWVFTPQSDRDNFLEPPSGVPPMEWINKLLDIFREMFLRDGAINLLRDILIKLYEERGVFNGSQDYPAISDLVQALEKLSFRQGSRFAGYLESLVNRFTGLLYSLPETLCCQKGYNLTKEKEGKIVIYDISSLSQEIANIYVNAKILREASYREKLPPEGMKVALVIEEAHTLFNTSLSERYDLGENYLLRAVRRLRKRGICFLFCDQSPADLPTTLSANVSNNFVLKTENDKNIQWVKNCMGLLPDQAEYLRVMPTRQVIFQSGDDYPVPVLLEIPKLSFDYVSAEEIEKYMRPVLDRLEYTPQDEKKETTVTDLTVADTASTAGKKEYEKPGRLWGKLLKYLAENQPVRHSEFSEQMEELKPWKRNSLIKEMENQEMLETCSVGLGTKGNTRKFVVIRQKGAEFIGADYEKLKLNGKGSTEHVILQHLIAKAMKEEGMAVLVEHHSNGKSVDIAEIRQDGSSIALEIELQPAHPHVSENVRRDLEAGFGKVIVITQNKAAQNQAHKQVFQNVDLLKQSKVEFKLVKEFFPKSKKKK